MGFKVFVAQIGSNVSRFEAQRHGEHADVRQQPRLQYPTRRAALPGLAEGLWLWAQCRTWRICRETRAQVLHVL